MTCFRKLPVQLHKGELQRTMLPYDRCFLSDQTRKIKAMLTYPMSTGRNFDEVLRLLDSCQLTAKHKVATPVNWKQGEDVIIVPAVSDAEAKEKYPEGWKSPKPYIRIVGQPK